MDPFWATMWGALAGAVVGAAAAWMFALDLRRRDRQALMSRHLGAIMQALAVFEQELIRGRQGPDFAALLRARYGVTSALQEARLDACETERAVLIAARQAIDATGHQWEEAVGVSAVASMLEAWWRDERRGRFAALRDASVGRVGVWWRRRRRSRAPWEKTAVAFVKMARPTPTNPGPISTEEGDIGA